MKSSWEFTTRGVLHWVLNGSMGLHPYRCAIIDLLLSPLVRCHGSVIRIIQVVSVLPRHSSSSASSSSNSN